MNNQEQVFVEEVEITPELAKKWLNLMAPNRTVSQSRVTQWAARLEKFGKFPQTGDTIKFDISGRLVDGQHRLMAIIESGVTVRALVARNVPLEDVATIDTGKSRSHADVLEIHGSAPNPRAGARAAMLLWFFERGVFNLNNQKRKPTQEECLEVYTRHSRLAHFISLVKPITPAGIRGGPGTWGAMIYWLALQNETAAQEFAGRLATGEELPSKHPILALRNRLTSRDKSKITDTELIGLVWKTWNHFRANEQVGIIRFNLSKEDYPTLSK